eukprot:CAMPEP_0182872524 /NCGR_PEP_ID=MMETSP0034_2-20130328/11762_1 /TAXON_ID=156128 /ORGANISM="Nephroselmis pyriformis, Strain CCMP717" /LENGTH=78 /DNA_ID=CAMNT_0025005113 /DNA_START=175 /DNA_END=408 /DNA_ORIENTATION=+
MEGTRGRRNADPSHKYMKAEVNQPPAVREAINIAQRGPSSYDEAILKLGKILHLSKDEISKEVDWHALSPMKPALQAA